MKTRVVVSVFPLDSATVMNCIVVSKLLHSDVQFRT